ncbi:MAG: SPOR domain-containing protein [Gammaproteobacteria bacterium]
MSVRNPTQTLQTLGLICALGFPSITVAAPSPWDCTATPDGQWDCQWKGPGPEPAPSPRVADGADSSAGTSTDTPTTSYATKDEEPSLWRRMGSWIGLGDDDDGAPSADTSAKEPAPAAAQPAQSTEPAKPASPPVTDAPRPEPEPAPTDEPDGGSADGEAKSEGSIFSAVGGWLGLGSGSGEDAESDADAPSAAADTAEPVPAPPPSASASESSPAVEPEPQPEPQPEPEPEPEAEAGESDDESSEGSVFNRLGSWLSDLASDSDDTGPADPAEPQATEESPAASADVEAASGVSEAPERRSAAKAYAMNAPAASGPESDAPSAGAAPPPPPAVYTIQLASARGASGVDAFRKTHGLDGAPHAERVWSHQGSRDGDAVTLLLYGRYPGFSDAKSALENLPTSLREAEVWIKPVANLP